MEHNLNAIKDEYSENEILGIKNMNKYEKKKMVEGGSRRRVDLRDLWDNKSKILIIGAPERKKSK